MLFIETQVIYNIVLASDVQHSDSALVQIIFHYVFVKLLSRVRLFATPWTVAYQAPPSMEFSRQEQWNGLPFPSPVGLPDPGIEPRSPALQADALPSELPQVIIRQWVQFPVLHSKSLLLTSFMYSSFYMLILYPQFVPAPYPLWQPQVCFPMTLFLFCIQIHLYNFADSTYK